MFLVKKNILSLLLASLFSCGGVTVTKGSFILISGLEGSIPVEKGTSAEDGEQKQSWRELSVKQRPLMHFHGSARIDSFHSHNYINRTGLYKTWSFPGVPNNTHAIHSRRHNESRMSEWETSITVEKSAFWLYVIPPRFLKLYIHVFIEPFFLCTFPYAWFTASRNEQRGEEGHQTACTFVYNLLLSSQ